ncbi:MAG: DUF192 domain-containing protein [Chloroflexota bacterium]|nr:DUF192 domain-containing protein [Chloroflexota bacterium]
MRITNSRTGEVLADRCKLARSPVARAVGLLNRSALERGEGLLLRPCSSVHCFFMRFPIDVAFLDGKGQVLKVYEPMKPWRASTIVRRAKQTLELPAGVLRQTGTRVGDVLVIEG